MQCLLLCIEVAYGFWYKTIYRRKKNAWLCLKVPERGTHTQCCGLRKQ